MPSFHEEITAVLAEVRKTLSAHGGGVSLVNADELTGEVRIRFEGACAGCPFAAATFEGVVEAALMEVPGVRGVRVIFGSDGEVAPSSGANV